MKNYPSELVPVGLYLYALLLRTQSFYLFSVRSLQDFKYHKTAVMVVHNDPTINTGYVINTLDMETLITHFFLFRLFSKGGKKCLESISFRPQAF